MKRDSDIIAIILGLMGTGIVVMIVGAVVGAFVLAFFAAVAGVVVLIFLFQAILWIVRVSKQAYDEAALERAARETADDQTIDNVRIDLSPETESIEKPSREKESIASTPGKRPPTLAELRGMEKKLFNLHRWGVSIALGLFILGLALGILGFIIESVEIEGDAPLVLYDSPNSDVITATVKHPQFFTTFLKGGDPKTDSTVRIKVSVSKPVALLPAGTTYYPKRLADPEKGDTVSTPMLVQVIKTYDGGWTKFSFASDTKRHYVEQIDLSSPVHKADTSFEGWVTTERLVPGETWPAYFFLGFCLIGTVGAIITLTSPAKSIGKVGMYIGSPGTLLISLVPTILASILFSLYKKNVIAQAKMEEAVNSV